MAISSNTTGLRPGVCTFGTRPLAPYEGQMIYETDTDLTYIWGGSAWQQVSGGTATGNSGLVHITSVSFSAATQVDFLNVFSSTYQTYRVEFENLTTTGGDDFFMRFRSSSGIISTTDYLVLRNEVTDTSNSGFYAGGGYANALRPTYIETGSSNMRSTGHMEIFNPYLSDYTNTSSTFSRVGNSIYVVNAAGYFRLTTSLTGFSFVRGGSGTITGKATVYGYRTN